MIMNIAKTQLANVKINFVKQQIEVLDDAKDSRSNLLSNYRIWLDQIK